MDRPCNVSQPIVELCEEMVHTKLNTSTSTSRSLHAVPAASSTPPSHSSLPTHPATPRPPTRSSSHQLSIHLSHTPSRHVVYTQHPITRHSYTRLSNLLRVRQPHSTRTQRCSDGSGTHSSTITRPYHIPHNEQPLSFHTASSHSLFLPRPPTASSHRGRVRRRHSHVGCRVHIASCTHPSEPPYLSKSLESDSSTPRSDAYRAHNFRSIAPMAMSSFERPNFTATSTISTSTPYNHLPYHRPRHILYQSRVGRSDCMAEQ